MSEAIHCDPSVAEVRVFAQRKGADVTEQDLVTEASSRSEKNDLSMKN